MNNPIQMIKALMGKNNPEQIATQLMSNNNNPLLTNLVNMVKKGDTKSVEEFARNIYKEQGKDFDKEFSEFMSNFKQ